MFFLVLICEDCEAEVSEVVLDCALSNVSVVFTARFPTLVLDFINSVIKSMMTIVEPVRQINKTTPREIAEINAVLSSIPPTLYNTDN